MRLRLAIVPAAIALVACAGPDADDDTCGEVYMPGMTASGPAGSTITLVAADPAPPARFINSWTIVASDPGGGAMGASAVVVSTFMPAHGHAGPPPAVTTGAAPELVVTPIDLWMPGLWEVTFAVSHAGGTDRAVFAFCVAE